MIPNTLLPIVVYGTPEYYSLERELQLLERSKPQEEKIETTQNNESSQKIKDLKARLSYAKTQRNDRIIEIVHLSFASLVAVGALTGCWAIGGLKAVFFAVGTTVAIPSGGILYFLYQKGFLSINKNSQK